MKRALIALSQALHAVVRRAAILAILIMLVTVLFQILARYLFNAPPIWTEEVARYMMVWSGLLGATMSFKTHSDAVLLDSVVPRDWRALTLLAEAIRSMAVIAFLGPVLYYCFFNLHGVFGRGFVGRSMSLTADTLGISMTWIVSAVPLCSAIILIHLVARWVDRSEISPAQDPIPAPLD